MINDQILEQVSHLNYLGNDTRCDRNYDIDVKLGKFHTICGTIIRIMDIDVKLGKFHTICRIMILMTSWVRSKRSVVQLYVL